SGFYPCFEPADASRHDAECRSVIDNCRALMFVERDIQTGVEIEKEFEEVMALTAEDVFDSPKTSTLVERDYSTMSDWRGEPVVGVMLGIKDVAFGVALPQIDLRTHVCGEYKGPAVTSFAYLLAVDSDRVVISGRAKQISIFLARGVNERSR